MSPRSLVVMLIVAVFGSPAPSLALTWQIDTVDSPGDVGWFASIALDQNGDPHVAYCAPATDDLKYASLVNGSWVLETVDATGRTGWYASLAFGADGYPRIAYWDLTNSSLRYARWDGAAWIRETVDNAAYVGQCCALALDSADLPRISYYDYTNGDLKYARWNGASWVIEVVDSGPAQLGTGLYTSLAIDEQDEPHISYADHTQGLLRYATWSGGTWTRETVDGGTPIGTSIALDQNEVPHISFAYQFGQGSHLKYSVRNGGGGAWVNRIVHTGGQVGLYSSLRLDAGGDARILSFDLGNGIVQYDAVEAGVWSRDDVESMGWTDQWCSLVLTAQGDPIGAYRSGMALDLHVARGSSPASAGEGQGAGPLAIRAYPNPSRVGEPVLLGIPASAGAASLVIVDATGRRVAGYGGGRTLATDLPGGHYFVRIDAPGFEGATRIVRLPR